MDDVENLQSAYGYYADMSMQDATSALFTDNSTLEILGRGVFLGSDRIYEYMRRLGAPTDGRLFTHMQLQPVITVSADGTRANIRARLFEMFGMNNAQAQLAEGTYENRFVLENGMWKYAGPERLPDFLLGLRTGLGQAFGAADELLPRLSARPAALRRIRTLSRRVRAALPLPQSGERPMNAAALCWLAAALAAAGRAAQLRRAQPPCAQTSTVAAAMQRVAMLEARAQRIKDINDIKRLQRAYGYYLDEGQWDDVADLFADDATLEIGKDGVYRGRERIRAYFRALGGGRNGLAPGQLNEHLQVMPVITLRADGAACQRHLARHHPVGPAGPRCVLERRPLRNRIRAARTASGRSPACTGSRRCASPTRAAGRRTPMRNDATFRRRPPEARCTAQLAVQDLARCLHAALPFPRPVSRS